MATKRHYFDKFDIFIITMGWIRLLEVVLVILISLTCLTNIVQRCIYWPPGGSVVCTCGHACGIESQVRKSLIEATLPSKYLCIKSRCMKLLLQANIQILIKLMLFHLFSESVMMEPLLTLKRPREVDLDAFIFCQEGNKPSDSLWDGVEKGLISIKM